MVRQPPSFKKIKGFKFIYKWPALRNIARSWEKKKKFWKKVSTQFVSKQCHRTSFNFTL